MPKTKSSNTVMTGVFLFLSPIVSACVVAAAQVAVKPSHIILYGLSGGVLAWFWIAVFIAYTRRVKSEGRVEQADIDIAILRGRPINVGGSDGKPKS